MKKGCWQNIKPELKPEKVDSERENDNWLETSNVEMAIIQ